MTGVYKIAGQVVSITTDHALTHKRCANWRSEETPQISVTVTQEDVEKRRRFLFLSGDRYPYPDDELESIVSLGMTACALLPFGVLHLHGSALSFDGQGVVFTAPSGTGKSTHTGLWRERFGDRVRMVNDDHPFLQIREDGIALHGSPWMGKHHIGENTEVPLKAIVLLTRGRDNSITRITAPDAFGRLLTQSLMPFDTESRMRELQLMTQLSERTELFRLECNMEIKAAEISCAAVIKGELL